MMFAQRQSSWEALVKMGRFLGVRTLVHILSAEESAPGRLEAFVDADHAGCRRTRRSTTPVTAMIGGACIRAASATQGLVALSSAESACCAARRAA